MGVKLSRGTMTWQLHLQICLTRVQKCWQQTYIILQGIRPLDSASSSLVDFVIVQMNGAKMNLFYNTSLSKGPICTVMGPHLGTFITSHLQSD